MTTYNVNIEELIGKTITIEAESPEEAIRTAISYRANPDYQITKSDVCGAPKVGVFDQEFNEIIPVDFWFKTTTPTIKNDNTNSHQSVKRLPLSHNIRTILDRENIQTISDLMAIPYDQLLQIRGLGINKAREIEESLIYTGFDQKAYLSEQSIETLELSVSTTKQLIRAGKTKIGDIINLSYTELLELRSIGTNRALEIERALVKKHLK